MACYETVRVIRLFPSEEVPIAFLDIGDIVSFHNVEIDISLLEEMDPVIQNMFRNLIVSTFDTAKKKGFIVIRRGITAGESYFDVSLGTTAFKSHALTLSNIETLSYYKFPLNTSPFPKNFILNRSSQYEIAFKIEHLIPTMKYDALY